MKKSVALLLAGVMALSLTACGGAWGSATRLRQTRRSGMPGTRARGPLRVHGCCRHIPGGARARLLRIVPPRLRGRCCPIGSGDGSGTARGMGKRLQDSLGRSVSRFGTRGGGGGRCRSTTLLLPNGGWCCTRSGGGN